MDKPLDAFEQWMVKQNLGYVQTEGLDNVVARLRAQGYNRVADHVEAEAKIAPNDRTPPVTSRSEPRFNTQDNIGRVKYVVNFHDGVKTHEDGSPFFDIRTFSNKKSRDKFCKDLKRQGYTEA